jgi:hypothetical protein
MCWRSIISDGNEIRSKAQLPIHVNLLTPWEAVLMVERH